MVQIFLVYIVTNGTITSCKEQRVFPLSCADIEDSTVHLMLLTSV